MQVVGTNNEEAISLRGFVAKRNKVSSNGSVSRACAQIEDIQNEYVNSYGKYLAYARLLTPVLMNAEDLVQQAFSNTLNQVVKGNDIHLDTLSAYIKSCVRNLSINKHNYDEKHTRDYSLRKDDATPDVIVELSEKKQAVVEAILQLTGSQRTAIVMYYFDELSVEEISSQLHLSKSTIKTNLKRARKHVQATISSDELFREDLS